jgi:hypothetical protein
MTSSPEWTTKKTPTVALAIVACLSVAIAMVVNTCYIAYSMHVTILYKNENEWFLVYLQKQYRQQNDIRNLFGVNNVTDNIMAYKTWENHVHHRMPDSMLPKCL